MSNQSLFTSIIESVKNESDGLGLYLQDVNVACSDVERVRELDESGESVVPFVESGEIDVAMFFDFSMKDFALSDENLFPEKIAEKHEFDMIVPDEFEQFKSSRSDDLLDGFD